MTDAQTASLVKTLARSIQVLAHAAAVLDGVQKKVALEYLDEKVRILENLMSALAAGKVFVVHATSSERLVDAIATQSDRIVESHRASDWQRVLRGSYDLLVEHLSTLPGEPGSVPIKLPPPPADD